ncbi:hypothetical protein PLICRDRAFT_44519 [Plicaturopsis crispa FD-325 SS-3]|nr:hypothetical protein PLICRDRAFT_44519 [Plicaturopsis crispa FD-325 SS-3]
MAPKLSKTTKASERPVKRARVDAQPQKSKGPPILHKKPAAVSKGKAKAKETRASDDDYRSPLPSTFKIIAGSYEKLLYGLEGSVSLSASSDSASSNSAEDSGGYNDGSGGGYKFHLKPIFIFPAHVSCIKAVAASPNGGKWLATGSADEIVKVWDLRRRKEIGGLMHHEGPFPLPLLSSPSPSSYTYTHQLTQFPRGVVGSITHLTFPTRSHLLSASEDGTLALFRARDWAVLRSLRGHTGRVNALAVHPSGKVALSVGRDRTLRMWDLMRGKGSASVKLGKGAYLIDWWWGGDIRLMWW